MGRGDHKISSNFKVQMPIKKPMFKKAFVDLYRFYIDLNFEL
jgi:hypothetical protein